MKAKRYQFFISSTYQDLRDERSAVQDAVISNGDFPVQMESFPAAAEDQFQFIKSLIDECDYYVLIIAGRYGSVADDGLSYTHKEFRYALAQVVPVLVMLRDDREDLPHKHSEQEPNGQKLLNEFIAEVETGRLRKAWKTIDGLKLAVREALDHAKATIPRTGWVRGNSLTNIEALEELNAVRKQNDEFRKLLGELKVEIELPQMPSVNDTVEIDILPKHNRARTSERGSNARIKASWISIFPFYFDNLEWSANDWNGEFYHNFDEEVSCINIGSSMAGELSKYDTRGLFTLKRSTFHRLTSYYIEAGLMQEDGETPFTQAANRLARRLRIDDAGAADFEVIDGSISVVEATALPREFDDDIPF